MQLIWVIWWGDERRIQFESTTYARYDQSLALGVCLFLKCNHIILILDTLLGDNSFNSITRRHRITSSKRINKSRSQLQGRRRGIVYQLGRPERHLTGWWFWGVPTATDILNRDRIISSMNHVISSLFRPRTENNSVEAVINDILSSQPFITSAVMRTLSSLATSGNKWSPYHHATNLIWPALFVGFGQFLPESKCTFGT